MAGDCGGPMAGDCCPGHRPTHVQYTYRLPLPVVHTSSNTRPIRVQHTRNKWTDLCFTHLTARGISRAQMGTCTDSNRARTTAATRRGTPACTPACRAGRAREARARQVRGRRGGAAGGAAEARRRSRQAPPGTETTCIARRAAALEAALSTAPTKGTVPR
jgi:hypothetical protein